MRSEKRVLMLGPSLDVRGGISTIEQFLLSHWLSQGKYKVYHIATLVDGTKWSKLLVAIAALIRFLSAMVIYRPDIIHIHFASRASFFRKSFFVLIARALKKKVIMHANGAEFHLFYNRESGPLQKRYIQYVLNRADRLIVVSRQWQEFYRRIYKRSQPIVVYNPVGCPDQCPDQDKRLPVVLTLGRLGQRKGTYDLLQAVPLILKYQPQAEFWLGGDGEVERVRELVSKESWGDRVRLLGWVTGEQKAEVLSRASVFILPSYNEGLPLAILEAMAYGLPVVSTPVGGIPEAVADGETGFLVQPGDVQAIAEKTVLLLKDDGLRKQMGANARQRALTHFDVRSVIHKIFEVYDGLYEE
ncbi:glycosyltransferase family 4 protein [uncultured Thermanaerothrix sp.]|uniref:glycosyltransferase family 4 protein n=1 Tax=uncultured Thermanaerothrix sp. TaxID=1195149 RepID=UPI0026371C1A|nr:glycosyltransferase family 4 protein [uncultured Thermanaerothrix sp.]